MKSIPHHHILTNQKYHHHQHHYHHQCHHHKEEEEKEEKGGRGGERKEDGQRRKRKISEPNYGSLFIDLHFVPLLHHLTCQTRHSFSFKRCPKPSPNYPLLQLHHTFKPRFKPEKFHTQGKKKEKCLSCTPLSNSRIS